MDNTASDWNLSNSAVVADGTPVLPVLPVLVAGSASGGSGSLSPFRGHCYLSYLDVRSSTIRTRSSTNGGLTWSAPVVSVPDSDLGFENGAQPVVQPDGTLVIVFDLAAGGAHYADPAANQIQAVRSTDGGRTFDSPVTVRCTNALRV